MTATLYESPPNIAYALRSEIACWRMSHCVSQSEESDWRRKELHDIIRNSKEWILRMPMKNKGVIGMQFSSLFEFFDLERFPNTEWMTLYQDPDKYATRVEEAQPRKIQQCECCGKAIQGKTWALKTGAKSYYRYYNYLCEDCYNKAPEIIAVREEMDRPSHNHFSQEIMDRFKRFKTRLSEEGLVEFATTEDFVIAKELARELKK